MEEEAVDLKMNSTLFGQNKALVGVGQERCFTKKKKKNPARVTDNLREHPYGVEGRQFLRFFFFYCN